MSGKREFSDELAQGRVFYWTDCDQLDDPNRTMRNKYGVILNTVYPNEIIYYVLTTSNLERYNRFALVRDNSLLIAEKTYAFWPDNTVIDCHNVPAQVPAADLKAIYDAGRVKFVGQLNKEHVEELTLIIRESPSIPKELLRFIIPW